jgi:hypothetical protein
MRVAFLWVTAAVEGVLGLFLVMLPDRPLTLLIGADNLAPETLLVGRFAGVALLAIGVVSGLARDDGGSPALRAVLAGILTYDVAAAALLVYAAIVMQMAGPVLWPAVVLHAALAVWCVLCLRAQTTP